MFLFIVKQNSVKTITSEEEPKCLNVGENEDDNN